MSELSWEEAGRLAADGTVAILPAGAIEAHGPHLPLETDVIIAEAMARAAGKRLAADGREVLLLPPLAYSPAPFAEEFPGTVSIRPQTLTALVVDIGVALARHGVRTLAVANAHLDPAHLAALAAAARTLEGEGVVCVLADLTRRRLAERLTAEFRTGACHAGCFETSIVLATRPDLVQEGRLELPAVPHSLSAAIQAGKRTFREVGGDRAYFGDPAAATAEEGEASIEELGRILAEAVEASVGAAR